MKIMKDIKQELTKYNEALDVGRFYLRIQIKHVFGLAEHHKNGTYGFG